MSERTRFTHLEMEERPRRRAAPRRQTQEPAEVRRVSATPPGATFTPSALLEPILQNTLAPTGRSEFHYLYDQIANVAAGQAGQGPLAQELGDHADIILTNVQPGDILVRDATNEFWENQQPGGGGGGAQLTVANTWTALQTFCIDDANNDVRRPVSLCHTHSGDLAAAPIGVGMAFEVELALGGAKQTIAQIDADTTALGSTPGAETGRLLLNVTSAGTENNELALYPQQLTIPRAPLASATRARVQIGSANWHFGGGAPGGVLNHGDTAGCVLGINEPVGYTGLLLAAGVAGIPLFTINSDAEHIATVRDTATTGPTTAFRLQHRLSSGTATVGHGVAMEWWAQNDAGTLQAGGGIRTEAGDTTAGAENISLLFLNRRGGSFGERARFSGTTGNLLVQDALMAITGVVAGSHITQNAVMETAPVQQAAPSQAEFTALRVTGAAHTDVAGSTDPIDVNFRLDRTVTFVSGHAGGGALQAVQIVGPTYAGASAVTFPTAATVFINSAPAAGANVTLTNRYALYVNGTARFDRGAQAHVWEVNEDNVDPTGGGGAATGRIPILVNGNLRYIPYYT